MSRQARRCRIYVTRKRHYFRVEGSFPGGVIRECFKY